ncbi:MAG: hypothetical protein QM642_00445 [Edaphocola sp.]
MFTLKSIGLIISSLLLSFTLFARKEKAEIISILKMESEYNDLPKSFTLAVMPIANCFSCESVMVNILKKKSKVLFVFPKTRKVVERDIRNVHIKNGICGIYLFNDSIYDSLKDTEQPKGYWIDFEK